LTLELDNFGPVLKRASGNRKPQGCGRKRKSPALRVKLAGSGPTPWSRDHTSPVIQRVGDNQRAGDGRQKMAAGVGDSGPPPACRGTLEETLTSIATFAQV